MTSTHSPPSLNPHSDTSDDDDEWPEAEEGIITSPLALHLLATNQQFLDPLLHFSKFVDFDDAFLCNFGETDSDWPEAEELPSNRSEQPATETVPEPCSTSPIRVGLTFDYFNTTTQLTNNEITNNNSPNRTDISILSLPLSLQSTIISYLDAKTITALRSTCRHFFYSCHQPLQISTNSTKSTRSTEEPCSFQFSAPQIPNSSLGSIAVHKHSSNGPIVVNNNNNNNNYLKTTTISPNHSITATPDPSSYQQLASDRLLETKYFSSHNIPRPDCQSRTHKPIQSKTNILSRSLIHTDILESILSSSTIQSSLNSASSHQTTPNLSNLSLSSFLHNHHHNFVVPLEQTDHGGIEPNITQFTQINPLSDLLSWETPFPSPTALFSYLLPSLILSQQSSKTSSILPSFTMSTSSTTPTYPKTSHIFDHTWLHPVANALDKSAHPSIYTLFAHFTHHAIAALAIHLSSQTPQNLSIDIPYSTISLINSIVPPIFHISPSLSPPTRVFNFSSLTQISLKLPLIFIPSSNHLFTQLKSILSSSISSTLALSPNLSAFFRLSTNVELNPSETQQTRCNYNEVLFAHIIPPQGFILELLQSIFNPTILESFSLDDSTDLSQFFSLIHQLSLSNPRPQMQCKSFTLINAMLSPDQLDAILNIISPTHLQSLTLSNLTITSPNSTPNFTSCFAHILNNFPHLSSLTISIHAMDLQSQNLFPFRTTVQGSPIIPTSVLLDQAFLLNVLHQPLFNLQQLSLSGIQFAHATPNTHLNRPNHHLTDTSTLTFDLFSLPPSISLLSEPTNTNPFPTIPHNTIDLEDIFSPPIHNDIQTLASSEVTSFTPLQTIFSAFSFLFPHLNTISVSPSPSNIPGESRTTLDLRSLASLSTLTNLSSIDLTPFDFATLLEELSRLKSQQIGICLAFPPSSPTTHIFIPNTYPESLISLISHLFPKITTLTLPALDPTPPTSLLLSDCKCYNILVKNNHFEIKVLASSTHHDGDRLTQIKEVVFCDNEDIQHDSQHKIDIIYIPCQTCCDGSKSIQ